MTTAIIVAAGKSTRMGEGVDKAFLSLLNKPVLAWSLLAFERSPKIDRIVLVVRKDQLLAAKAVAKMFGISKLQAVVAGGTRRQESVQAGFAVCDADTRYVVIHDAARPLVTSELVTEVVQAARGVPALAVGRPVVDTIKRLTKSKGTVVEETVPRERLWSVQTPQVFQIKTLRDAFKALSPKDEVTDECQAVEKTGEVVKIFEYLKPNFKITTPEDMQLVSMLLK